MRIHSGLILLAAALLGNGALLATAAEPFLIHIATNGNDRWSGRLAVPDAQGTDGPLRSLTGARDRIRSLRTENKVQTTPITVLVHG